MSVPFHSLRFLAKLRSASEHAPYHLFAWNELGYFLFGTVHVLDTVRELGPEFVRIALDLP